MPNFDNQNFLEKIQTIKNRIIIEMKNTKEKTENFTRAKKNVNIKFLNVIFRKL